MTVIAACFHRKPSVHCFIIGPAAWTRFGCLTMRPTQLQAEEDKPEKFCKDFLQNIPRVVAESLRRGVRWRL